MRCYHLTLTKGAYHTGQYPNLFKEYGYSDEAIQNKVNQAFHELFYGPDRIYHPVGHDMGYITDTGNNDVRTEGMSYGMMMCLQLDRKEEFDRLWKWSKTYMQHDSGRYKGYFAWSCALDGTRNAQGPAPDGEEFFAMALFFASSRWGDGEPPFDYSQQAKYILHECVHKGEEDNPGDPMWHPEKKLIKFVPESSFSDPSYHLPHFYELFAIYGNEEDRDFWKEAAQASRDYLKLACHPETGLAPEYAEYTGEPHQGPHQYFYSDSYRVAANIGLDSAWFGKTEINKNIANNIQHFFAQIGFNLDDYMVYHIDGTRLNQKALHPHGLLATNAQASLAADGPHIEDFVRAFWDLPLRKGQRRYYDNCLQMFALLALSGMYRIY